MTNFNAYASKNNNDLTYKTFLSGKHFLNKTLHSFLIANPCTKFPKP